MIKVAAFKYSLILLIIVGISKNSLSQGFSLGSDPSENYSPRIIPPSPEAAGLGKYVDFGVSEYTGRSTVNIPIYNLKEGDLNMPINLSYSSGGFSIEEIATWTGLGWTLNAGGVVTRSMQGAPDNISESNFGQGFLTLAEQTSYEFLINGGSDLIRLNYLKDISNGCFDSQPDIFYFNVNGHTGKFNFHWDSDETNPVVVDSESDVEIEIIWNDGYNSQIDGWIIRMDDGMSYEFSVAENTQINSSSTIQCFFDSRIDFNSSWFLKEIRNVTDNKFIKFDYEPYTIEEYDINHSTIRKHYAATGDNDTCSGSFAGEDSETKSTISIAGQRLSRIYTSTSPIEIHFIPSDNAGLAKLTEIEVINATSGSSIMTYSLDHVGDLLTSVQQKNGEINIPAYQFEYYDSKNGGENAKDHWGFRNNNSNELFPRYFIQTSDNNKHFFGTGNRNPDFEGSVANVLKKITYPTGGYDEYFYQLHDYGYINGNILDENKIDSKSIYRVSYGITGYDGCRVGDIETDTKSADFTVVAAPGIKEVVIEVSAHLVRGNDFSGGFQPQITIYNEAGQSIFNLSAGINTETRVNEVISLEPGQYKLVTEATWNTCDDPARDKAEVTIKYKNWTNEPLTTKPAGGVRVSKINKHDYDDLLLKSMSYDYVMDNGFSSGYIFGEPSYVYSDVQMQFVSDGGTFDLYVPCSYIIVLESNRSNLGSTEGSHIGYQRIIFTENEGENGQVISSYDIVPNGITDTSPFPPATSYSHKSGELKKQEIKNFTGATLNQKIVNYDFANKETKAFKVNFKGGDQLFPSSFDIGTYKLISGHSRPSQQVDHLFDDSGGEIIQERVYQFDTGLHNLYEEKSKGTNEDYLSRYYYPKDVLSPNAQIQNLIDHRVIDKPIEKIQLLEEEGKVYVLKATYFEYNNETHLETARTFDSETPILLDDFNLAIDNGGALDSRYTDLPEIELLYDLNTDNLIEKRTRGNVESYIWNNKGYPIVQIQNAELAQCFYTSFEADGMLGISKMGAYHRNSGSYNFEADGGFIPSDASILKMSYWYWESAQWKFSGELDFDNIISQGMKLDELRAYPKDAQLSTYSYNDAMQINSTIDANGIQNTYEYDNLNRLIKIRDNNNDIVKKYEYWYKKE